MAKNTIYIMTPNGHRRKTQISDSGNLLKVLEEICSEEELDSSQWELIYQRRSCDLMLPWRFLNMPHNVVLEMCKLEVPRVTDDVNIQLQLPDNSRYTGWFEPSVTLQQMLDWYRFQPDSMIAALDISMSDTRDLCPVCSYMGKEIIGDYALSNTTLRELGLTGGKAVIHYHVRSISDEELRKINIRVDEKIVHERSRTSIQSKSTSTASAAPRTRTPPISSDSIRAQSKSLHSTPHIEPPSIFQNPPIGGTHVSPKVSSSENRSRTLAEELGIKFSLDHEPSEDQHRKQKEFQNFKFSPATKGKDLLSNLSTDETSRLANIKPCDRRTIAYDVDKTHPIDNRRTAKSQESSENFYELTADDLRSVLRQLHQESSNDIPLQTQAMRYKEHCQYGATYEHIAIRFVVNSRHILQGLFRPEEPVFRLLEFVRSNLVCENFRDADFYLYTSQPRVILEDLKKPLSDYDLIPAAFVYLGHRTVSPLNVKLSSSVPIRSLDEANRIVTEYVYKRSKQQDQITPRSVVSERPTSVASVRSHVTTPRKPSNNDMDDKQLREKLKKFLPTRK